MRADKSQRGLTVIEALVTLAVMMPLVLGLYTLLDSSGKISKQETNVSEAQQAVRRGIYEVTRLLRQARAGQIYLGNAILPVFNNAGAGLSIKDVAGNDHQIRQGTDVIEARGVILSDKYALGPGDLICSGSCGNTSQITLSLRSTATTGIVNFPPAQLPPLAWKTRPFYLVVADSSTQPVTVAGKTYLVPLYYVGLVNADASGGWYTFSQNGGAATFTFAMNPADPGARRFNAAAGTTPALQKPFFCGVVDDLIFFVDEGSGAPAGTDTHPTLALGVFDPSSGNYDVQSLVDEVEDFQVAFGIDGIDGSVPDRGTDPTQVDLAGANRDEWVGNVGGEVESVLGVANSAPPRTTSADAFVDSTVPTTSNAPALAQPALRALLISLVIKSRDPEMSYTGPGSLGVAALDSTAKPMSDPSITGRPYRRRFQSIAVTLRNYQ